MSGGEKAGQTLQPLQRFDQVNDDFFFLSSLQLRAEAESSISLGSSAVSCF